MTTLSPLDVRFACTCGGASSAHSVGTGLVMRCEHCKECDGYRPARCVCHLKRDDGKPIPCYFDHGNGGVVGHAAIASRCYDPLNDRLPVRRGSSGEMGNVAMQHVGSNPAHSQDLYAAWYERQLAERPEGHAAHKRIRSLTKLWATCVECHDAKVRKLQASKDVHVREKANVMAARRGIK